MFVVLVSASNRITSGTVEVGGIGEGIINFREETIVAYKVPCIIAAIVLDEVEVVKRIHS